MVIEKLKAFDNASSLVLTLTFFYRKDEPIVIHFNRITAIEKKNIALLIPNSLEIEVEGKTRHFFATFFNRDETFQVMNLLWNAHVKVS